MEIINFISQRLGNFIFRGFSRILFTCAYLFIIKGNLSINVHQFNVQTAVVFIYILL